MRLLVVSAAAAAAAAAVAGEAVVPRGGGPLGSAERVRREALVVLRGRFDSSLGLVSQGSPPYASALTSTVAAYALSRHRPGEAMRELSAVLALQWEDGLVPAYSFPGAAARDELVADGLSLGSFALWNGTGRLEGPSVPLAALPLQASVALQIYEACDDRYAAAKWALGVVPALYRWHRFLRARPATPGGAPPVRLAHPWEAPSRPEADGLGVAKCLVATDWSTDCFGAVDVAFEATLARSEVALAKLLEALERRRLAPGLPNDARRVVRKSELAARDRLDGLWTSNRFASAVRTDDDAWAPAPAATDIAALSLPCLAARRRDALVAHLLPGGRLACGPPLPDAECVGDPPAWPRGARVDVFLNLLVERGLRRVQEVSLADWLRDATLRLLARNYVPDVDDDDDDDDDNSTTTAAAYSLFDDDDDIVPPSSSSFRLDLYRAYDAAGVGLADDPDGNRSALAAAVAVLLTTPDAAETDFPDAPVSRSVVFAVVLVELVVASLVAFACLATNLLMIRELRQTDTTLTSAAASYSGLSPRPFFHTGRPARRSLQTTTFAPPPK